MKPSPDLPELIIAPTDGLRPHEHPDSQRAEPLVEALQRDGVLKNPPIVMPIQEREREYVVLDGANRAAALSLLGVPHALVQVVHPNGDQVSVETWNHILLDERRSDMVVELFEASELDLAASSPDQAALDFRLGKALAAVVTPQGRLFEVYGEGPDLRSRLSTLNKLVDVYQGQVRFERTSSEDVQPLLELFGDLACLVMFPGFSVSEVVRGASNGWHFPAGITRFIVSPRALRVNYPLERLQAQAPLEHKQAELDSWVKQRVHDRRVRYYAESSFLFDE